jgi:hypothetical protein
VAERTSARNTAPAVQPINPSPDWRPTARHNSAYAGHSVPRNPLGSTLRPSQVPARLTAGDVPRNPVGSIPRWSAGLTLRPSQVPARLAAGDELRAGLKDEEPSRVHDVINSGGGQPLDPGVRADMEARLGHDFGDVRVHDDARAEESAKAVNADAYTAGSNIVFQHDRYDPSSDAGRITLAHELTHVIQQRSGSVDGTSVLGGVRLSDPTDRFEQEAAATAERVTAVGGSRVQGQGDASQQNSRAGGPVVQRSVAGALSGAFIGAEEGTEEGSVVGPEGALLGFVVGAGVGALAGAFDLMGKRGRPASNVDQNKQFADAVQEIQRRIGRRLTKDEIRQLHEALHGEDDPGYAEIVNLGVAMFGTPGSSAGGEGPPSDDPGDPGSDYSSGSSAGGDNGSGSGETSNGSSE